MQKLFYLYGYPEIDLTQGPDGIDDGVMNMLIIGVGVMGGVTGASKFIVKISQMLAEGMTKKMLSMALTKKTAYQVAKKVLNYFTVSLTKNLAAKGVANSIKFVGGVIAGGITLVTFNKSCENLYSTLRESPLSDPNYKPDGAVIDSKYVTVEEVEEELEKELHFEAEEE